MVNSYSISSNQIFGNSYAILRYFSEYSKFKNGERGDVEGIKLSLIAPGNGMEVVEVKVPNISDIGITIEQLMESAKRMEFVLVALDGLTVTPYVRDGRSAASYKAKAVKIMDVVSMTSNSKKAHP